MFKNKKFNDIFFVGLPSRAKAIFTKTQKINTRAEVSLPGGKRVCRSWLSKSVSLRLQRSNPKKFLELTCIQKIFVALFLCCNLFVNNAAFAILEFPTDNVYPDLNYEFTGKDTCEKFNRKLFVFNLKLNKYILRPVNTVWASIMPKYGMDRIQNAYNNINYPVRLAGCLFQKDFKAAKQETVRFLTNTTIGFAGLYDPAKTKFHLEARQEDIEQALAKKFKKSGPYIVLPAVQGNVRDLIGKILACPLRPTSYAGFIGSAANLLFMVNNSTYFQPVFKKVDESYADPYIIAKEADGVSDYIKLENLDRSEVLNEKTKCQNLINVSQNFDSQCVYPDVELKDFNSQGSVVDSFRTTFFDSQSLGKSIWSDMSVWNRTFGKKLKTSSVSISPKKPKYRYRYILQKTPNSPLAILYPSIGEGITAEKSVVLAKMLYDEGYSVLIQGSSFNWEFIKSMPDGYVPGLPTQDAQYLRLTTKKIIDKIEAKKGYKFNQKILVGCSFGALTGLFTAAQEDKDNTLNISKYIAINPPVEVLYSLKKLDTYCEDWKKDSSDIKMKTAVTAEKLVKVYSDISQKEVEQMPKSIPLTQDEAELAMGFIMKQKLYDVVFAIENDSRGKQSGLEDRVNKMSFKEYAQSYLNVNDENYDSVNYQTSLYSIKDYLATKQNYKIYHSIDDYFVNPTELSWLKEQTKNKTLLFSNGSHLGEMYRKEFTNQFKDDISLKPQENTQGKPQGSPNTENVKPINSISEANGRITE